MIKQKQAGFTLLEALIVVSIIGILAGVLIIRYPSVAQKAKVANALRFSDNLRGSLQPDMVVWWKLDEISGTVASDTWWNKLDGTVNGATWVEGIKNNALSFDGVDDYVDMGSASSLDGISNGTMSAWIYLNGWGHDNRGMIFSKSSGENINNSNLNFPVRNVAGNGEATIGVSFGFNNTFASCRGVDNTLTLNRWYFVVFTWNQTAKTVNVYVNGAEISYSIHTTGVGTYTSNDSDNLLIGGTSYVANGGNRWFNGLIDDVQIYSVALPVAVIQQIYADGLKTHQNLAIK